ncbi:MAG: hypothetical protein DHS20C01_11790 [marine bacterium B5-7]|nr:MAG: hypothetical protein DHS20C01_11790 [marine bacterium B5-7]
MTSGVLLRVRVTHVGLHNYIELSAGTRARIVRGDELFAVLAPVAPGTLRASSTDDMMLLDPSGVVAQVAMPGYLYDRSTRVECIGVACDVYGIPINLARNAIASVPDPSLSTPVIAVIGERHLPGEPCRSADIIRGLAQSGFNVASANLGNVQGCWKTLLLRNAGASHVLDLADVGHVSLVNKSPDELERIFNSLVGYLSNAGTEVIVIDMEQDVFAEESVALLSLPGVANRIGTIVLESKSASSSLLERDSLRALGYDVTMVDSPGVHPQYNRLI